jgi:hypothetical protein
VLVDHSVCTNIEKDGLPVPSSSEIYPIWTEPIDESARPSGEICSKHHQEVPDTVNEYNGKIGLIY